MMPLSEMFQYPLWPRVRKRVAEHTFVRRSDAYLLHVPVGILSIQLAYIMWETPYLRKLVGAVLIQMLRDRLVNAKERDKAARQFINEHDRKGRAWNTAQRLAASRNLAAERQRLKNERAIERYTRKHFSPQGMKTRDTRRRNQRSVE